MKPENVKPGDVMIDGTSDLVHYTVLEVNPPVVNEDGIRVVSAHVRYRDGGDGYREWPTDYDAPLTRP